MRRLKLSEPALVMWILSLTLFPFCWPHFAPGEWVIYWLIFVPLLGGFQCSSWRLQKALERQY